MASTDDASTIEGQFQHVLVPLDGSEFAAAAMPTAQALAGHLGADVHTVSVAESADDVDGLRSHAAQVLGADEGDGRVHVVVGDDPAAAIAQRASELEGSLECLSSHGRGRIAGTVLGSVARSLLLGTREPIVVVGPFANRPGPFGTPEPAPLSSPRLVACVDGGAASERVLPVAAAWADMLGVALTILTVAEPSPPPIRPDETWHRHHGPDADADAYVRRLGEVWNDRTATVVDTFVVYDPVGPAEGVKRYLEDHPAGMIAVTTHARTGLQRAVLGAGAAAAAIVHASSAPALVVPLGG